MPLAPTILLSVIDEALKHLLPPVGDLNLRHVQAVTIHRCRVHWLPSLNKSRIDTASRKRFVVKRSSSSVRKPQAAAAQPLPLPDVDVEPDVADADEVKVDVDDDDGALLVRMLGELLEDRCPPKTSPPLAPSNVRSDVVGPVGFPRAGKSHCRLDQISV